MCLGSALSFACRPEVNACIGKGLGLSGENAVQGKLYMSLFTGNFNRRRTFCDSVNWASRKPYRRSYDAEL